MLFFWAKMTHILQGTFGMTAVCNAIYCNIKMVTEYHLEKGVKIAMCGREYL